MKKLIRTLVVATAIVGLSSLGFAQTSGAQDGKAQGKRFEGKSGQRVKGDGFQGKHGRGMQFGRMAHRLNLSEAQKEQLRSIRRGEAEKYRALAQQMRANPQARETFRAQFMELRKQGHQSFLSVLTAEQRAQLDEMRANRGKGRDGKPARRGGAPART
jgi:Spy/CpxP family protein refolding chaperone